MTSNNTQKALFVTELGKPVTQGSREIPEPGPGEVLIKITGTQSLFSLLINLISHTNMP